MEIINRKTVRIDFKKSTVIPLLHFIQHDHNVIRFELTDNGQAADLSNISRIIVHFRRKDGYVVEKELPIAEGSNILDYEIQSVEMACIGRARVVLHLYDLEDRLSTVIFSVQIVPTIEKDYSQPEEKAQLTLLQTLIVETKEAMDGANQAASNAQTQADYAKEQGDYAKQVAEENKTVWKTAVATFDEIAATYPDPENGWMVQTLDDFKCYRYVNGSWIFTQKINVDLSEYYNKIEIDEALNEKADADHTHSMEDVNGLQEALDLKADTSIMNAELDKKANSSDLEFTTDEDIETLWNN